MSSGVGIKKNSNEETSSKKSQTSKAAKVYRNINNKNV